MSVVGFGKTLPMNSATKVLMCTDSRTDSYMNNLADLSEIPVLFPKLQYT
jgi:hypothetical protein